MLRETQLWLFSHPQPLAVFWHNGIGEPYQLQYSPLPPLEELDELLLDEELELLLELEELEELLDELVEPPLLPP